MSPVGTKLPATDVGRLAWADLCHDGVRCWHLADVSVALGHVRFEGRADILKS